MAAYLFIDGGYLKARFNACMDRYYDEAVELSIPLVRSTMALRSGERIAKVFYYDCIDERPIKDQPQEMTADRIKQQEALFDSIRSCEGWHVREGRLVGARKDNRSQKRVDVLLAVEMLSHAFNKNMSHALLIAGDDDFTPLVDELLRHGTYVEVWSDRIHRSQHLVHAADLGRSMGFEFYWNLTTQAFRSAHLFPVSGKNRLHTPGRVLKFGTSKLGPNVKIMDCGGTFHFVIFEAPELYSLLYAMELKVLEEYLQEAPEIQAVLPQEWTIATR